MYHAPHSTIQVELLDHGMIVSYEEPEKHTRMVGGVHVDSTTQLLIQMLPQIMEVIPGSEGEEWDDRKEKRKSLMKLGMEKAMESLKPKAVEEWYWERKRVVVPDNQALSAVLLKAREAMDKAKALEKTGVHVHHVGHYATSYAGGIGGYAVPPLQGLAPSAPSISGYDVDVDQEPG